MSHENDDLQLDTALRQHLVAQLDCQLGRASSAFKAAARRERPIPMRPAMPAWAWAGVAAAIAACVAIAIRLNIRADQPTRVVVNTPGAVTTAVDSPGPVSCGRFEEVKRTAFDDEGVRLLDDRTPVRQIRRRTLREIQYFDSDGRARIKATVPDEQIMFVEMTKL